MRIDILRGEPETGRRDGGTHRQPGRQLGAAQFTARLKKVRPRGPVNSPIHSPSTEQRRIGCIDDCVH